MAHVPSQHNFSSAGACHHSRPDCYNTCHSYLVNSFTQICYILYLIYNNMFPQFHQHLSANTKDRCGGSLWESDLTGRDLVMLFGTFFCIQGCFGFWLVPFPVFCTLCLLLLSSHLRCVWGCPFACCVWRLASGSRACARGSDVLSLERAVPLLRRDIEWVRTCAVALSSGTL